jgi:hypothetical protein
MTRFQMGTALVLASLMMGVVVAALGVTGDSPNRFQIVRASDTMAWRLDTWTGEVDPCRRLVDGGMRCEPARTAALAKKPY